MAITATVAVSDRGISMSGAYLKIPAVTVKKYGVGGNASFRLLYDVHIYKNASTRNSDTEGGNPSISVPEVDHFTCAYTAGSNNVFALAYAHLKQQTSYLSSISDA